MAEGKKSFLLYTELIHTVEKMPDDKAGLLFKHILRYVNDLNPETEDLIVQLTFEHIKQGLKRNLRNWEKSVEQKSEAGLNSALSKFEKKLKFSTNKEVKGYITDIKNRLLEDENNQYLIKSLDLCQHYLTKSTGVESRSTESTVNVNVSVNDNVSVKESNINKKEISLVLKNEILENEIWSETQMKAHKLSKEKFEGLFEKFWSENYEGHILTNTPKQQNEIKRHFSNWTKKQKTDGKPKQSRLEKFASASGQQYN